MKKNLLFKIGLIKLAFLISFLNINNLTYSDDNRNFYCKVASVIVGVGIFSILMAKFFKKSDQQIINEAKKALECEYFYCVELSIFESYFSILNLSNADKEKIINDVNEEINYQLSGCLNKFVNMDDYIRINSYIHQLESQVNNLKYYKKSLEERLNKNEINDSLLEEKQNLLIKMNNLILKLDFLHKFVRKHKSYFSLIKTTTLLMQIYSDEIMILSRCNQSNLEMSLIKCARVKFNKEKVTKLIKYAFNLENNIADLGYDLNHLSFNYAYLMQEGLTLKNNLTTIWNIIVGSEEYLKEQREYEAARKEEERLAMEREKLALKEREVFAREREALAKLKETELKQKELLQNKPNIHIHYPAR